MTNETEQKKPDDGTASELTQLLSTIPDDVQYAIYHALISAGGYSRMLRAMTADELAAAKNLAAELHRKFLYGHSR